VSGKGRLSALIVHIQAELSLISAIAAVLKSQDLNKYTASKEYLTAMSTLKLGPVRQIGYIVKDIERSMREWIALGVGPWYYMENVPVENFHYMDKPYDLQMSIALSNSGDIQIELIQQRNDVPSLYRDFLRTAGEGAQHVSHWVYDFDDKSRLLLDLGYRVGHSGSIGSMLRFAYFINDQIPGTIIEISDLTDLTEEYFKSIADAAANWDGTDPIRC